MTNSEPDQSAVLTLPEFCRLARISVRTFHTMTTQGIAPSTVRIGRRRLVRRATADAWLQEREAA